ncbi:MAG: thiamine phosphate synthase [Deltaproteobacteria bacterium]|jgi:thiamine-phosphate pyrophosphorylase|nr:thiamine phosphate synthase [Deltaproteobacteria bacterium]
MTREELARKLRLTLVISQAEAQPRSIFELAELSFEGGVTALQLREKKLDGHSLYELASALAVFCRERNKIFIVNDRLDIALASGADGVHLGQSDLPASAAAALLPKEKILGISAATLEEAESARKAGADYLGVGAIIKTDSKIEAQEIDFSELPLINSLGPVTVAIGGIQEDNAAKIWAMGFDGLAVISALAKSQNPQASAGNLLKVAPD